MRVGIVELVVLVDVDRIGAEDDPIGLAVEQAIVIGIGIDRARAGVQVAGVGPGIGLHVVAQAVAVRVTVGRIGLEPQLTEIEDPVAIGVAGDQSVVIGVLGSVGNRVRVGVAVENVGQPVTVGVLVPGRLVAIQDVVAVLVRVEIGPGCVVRLLEIVFLTIGQPVAVEIQFSVGGVVRIETGRRRGAVVDLPVVAHAVVVGILVVGLGGVGRGRVAVGTVVLLPVGQCVLVGILVTKSIEVGIASVYKSTLHQIHHKWRWH